ncbi:hypothetical protein [Hyphomonas sp.]|uniref:hypothetical protein n=1 Tax=Hyphomonas sp. TaxID=87 RepID=UPI003D2C35E2
MAFRLALLCLSLWLLAAGAAAAAQDKCRTADMQMPHQGAMSMQDDCDMGAMHDSDPAPSDSTDMPGMTACCCPAILASLPGAPRPVSLAAPFPPSFDKPFGESATSCPSVPEPPPPRA